MIDMRNAVSVPDGGERGQREVDAAVKRPEARVAASEPLHQGDAPAHGDGDEEDVGACVEDVDAEERLERGAGVQRRRGERQQGEAGVEGRQRVLQAAHLAPGRLAERHCVRAGGRAGCSGASVRGAARARRGAAQAGWRVAGGGAGVRASVVQVRQQAAAAGGGAVCAAGVLLDGADGHVALDVHQRSVQIEIVPVKYPRHVQAQGLRQRPPARSRAPLSVRVRGGGRSGAGWPSHELNVEACQRRVVAGAASAWGREGARRPIRAGIAIQREVVNTIASLNDCQLTAHPVGVVHKRRVSLHAHRDACQSCIGVYIVLMLEEEKATIPFIIRKYI